MSKESNSSQFNFDKLSSEEWWKKIDIDLKGKSREILNRRIVDDLKTRPFYHYDESSPVTFQYQQRDSKFLLNDSWILGQKFFIKKGNEKEIAQLISESISGDAKYLEISFEDEFDKVPVLDALKQLDGFLILNCQNVEILTNYFNSFKTVIDIPIIAEPDFVLAMLNGDLNSYLEKFADDSKFITLNSNCFVEAGANEVEEAVFTLAALNEIAAYIAETKNKSKILLRLNTGSNFFLQIAKFRSIRKLAEFILLQWGIHTELIIEAQSSKWNKSVYDRFTNILRLSSESFSAIVGGVDILNISGFEESLKIENGFTHRNARNISHLLKHESHLDKVMDHAAGSYFVENLSQEYSEMVWKGFQDIENKGGIRKYNSQHSILELLEDSKNKNQTLFGEGKIKMLGTNTYPNPLDELTQENIEERETNRLAYNFEKLRAAVDLKSIKNNGKRPVATLLKLGRSEMRFARAGFATNFLECAGIRIQESDEISDHLKGVEFAVLCSGDDEYLENATTWAGNIKAKYPQLKLILAGFPENSEELKNAGVDFFIHLRAPLEKTLIDILKSIGIEKA